jgi:hypothetical protein
VVRVESVFRERWREIGNDRDIIIGRVINVTGMIGVLSGLVRFAAALVFLLFRRGLGFDIAQLFQWFW